MIVSDAVLQSLISMVGKVLIEGALPTVAVLISHRLTRRSVRQVDRKVEQVKQAIIAGGELNSLSTMAVPIVSTDVDASDIPIPFPSSQER